MDYKLRMMRIQALERKLSSCLPLENRISDLDAQKVLDFMSGSPRTPGGLPLSCTATDVEFDTLESLIDGWGLK